MIYQTISLVLSNTKQAKCFIQISNKNVGLYTAQIRLALLKEAFLGSGSAEVKKLLLSVSWYS